jgi:hypothetical protein
LKAGINLIVMAVLAVGCSTGPSFSASVISTANTVGTGEQRVLIELRDDEGRPLAVDVVPEATLRNEDGSPLGIYPGELVWLVPDDVPAYVFVMDIPEPETYQVTVDGGELGETPPAGFVAVADPVQVEAGEPAPSVDGEPVSGPALVVFASPDWCPSSSCQPMIEQVEAAVAGSAELSWAQVEVFANPEVDSEDELELAPVIDEWGIPSQPWLYVVDGDGVVVSLFEGAVSDGELAESVETLASR